MSSNQKLLQKADIALNDLASNGGLLNPEQASSFIRRLIKQPTIMNEVRVVTMKAPQRKIDRIGFANRILRKAPASGTALSQSQRAKPTTDQIELNAKEHIAEVWLPYDVVEDAIESAEAANNEASNSGPGGIRETIIQLMAERAASDLEEYLLHAATDYVDADPDTQDWFRMDDGWLKTAEDRGNVFDAGGQAMDKRLFKKGLQTMPVEWLRNRASMKHYVSMYQEAEYQDYLSNRGTAMGDRRLEGNSQAWAYGSPVVGVQHMPDDVGLFTNPDNLIVGFWRQVSMEYDKDISARVYKIVLTMRVAVEIEQAEGVVKYENIGDVD